MHGKKYYNPLCKVTRKYELRVKRIGSLLLESYVPIDSSMGIAWNRLPEDIKNLANFNANNLFSGLK